MQNNGGSTSPHSAFCIHHSTLHAMPSAARDIVVSNKLGLHARPAMQFVDVANQFASSVMVKKGGEEPCEADGKSVMQMIILAATEGTPLRIEAEGADAQAAVDKLAELFEQKFGEED
jgi:phosphocarrier protein